MKNSLGMKPCSAPRYAANGNAALLVWRESDAWRGSSATLVDFGFDGCTIRVEDFPPRGGAAWLCLAATGPAPWLHGTVITTIKTGRFSWVRRVVNLRFHEPCPYDVFKAAVGGFSQTWTVPEFESSRFSEREWR